MQLQSDTAGGKRRRWESNRDIRGCSKHLVGWLAGWLVGWVVGWLSVSWLVGQLVLLVVQDDKFIPPHQSWSKKPSILGKNTYQLVPNFVHRRSCPLIMRDLPLCRRGFCSIGPRGRWHEKVEELAGRGISVRHLALWCVFSNLSTSGLVLKIGNPQTRIEIATRSADASGQSPINKLGLTNLESVRSS